MTKNEFNKRAVLNGGYDRKIGKWEIIDIHIIPEVIEEYHELDFYCNEGDEVVLLRIRNRQEEKYEIVKSSSIDYWIAEIPVKEINNETIINTLNKFRSIA